MGSLLYERGIFVTQNFEQLNVTRPEVVGKIHEDVGVLPLVSYKNAEFLHNEVPGMQNPAEIRERMRKTPGGEPARKEGVKIAREMLFAVRERVQGAYLMPPLGRYELAPPGARRPEALDCRAVASSAAWATTAARTDRWAGIPRH